MWARQILAAWASPATMRSRCEPWGTKVHLGLENRDGEASREHEEIQVGDTRHNSFNLQQIHDIGTTNYPQSTDEEAEAQGE